MILPPATLGVLGGGQLGNYFCLAARDMGYHTLVFDPDPKAPAVAHEHLCAKYEDKSALNLFAARCAAVTVEFENIPLNTLNYLEAKVPLRPWPMAVGMTQNRLLEKNFLADQGFPHVPYVPVEKTEDLQMVPGQLFPAILKLQQMGYDGKGQKRVGNSVEARAAWVEMGSAPCVLEKQMDLTDEYSVVLARNHKNEIATYPAARNFHRRGVLDYSLISREPPPLMERMKEIAIAIAMRLNHEGVLCVEYFVADGKLWVNEIAPRPHNSGHYTLDACLNSQFQQQVRVLCQMPLAPTTMVSDAAMVNLMGELWDNGEPYWEHLLLMPKVNMHLYGKANPRAGRKMGHYTVLGDSVDEAWAIASQVRTRLGI